VQLKNSERELWLHADTLEERLEWVSAIKSVQEKKNAQPPASGDSSMPQWEINIEQLTLLNKVGTGSFGEVFRARLWGTEIAVKTLKTEEFAVSSTQYHPSTQLIYGQMLQCLVSRVVV
jgi:hypothetical protein